MSVTFDSKGNATLDSVAFIRKEELKINSSNETSYVRSNRLTLLYQTYGLEFGTTKRIKHYNYDDDRFDDEYDFDDDEDFCSCAKSQMIQILWLVVFALIFFLFHKFY